MADEAELTDTRFPKNAAEALCFERLKTQGWTVCRRGWPDFLAVKGDRVIAIEVKPSGGYQLKREQLFVLTWLAEAGLEIYTWTPDDISPVRWRS